MNYVNRIISSCLTLAVGAFSPYALAQDEQGENIEEEVIVIGIRQSIQSATDLKKNSDNVVDAITSEDVGKFPDQNVLDSLQRITGVQIGRDFTGEAASFTIRGISQNRVELNGRTVAAGEDESRQVNLSDIPSELISQLEVIKSPTADMTEGSLGATVNLKTARPFDRKKTLRKLSGKVRYGDNVEEVFPNISGFFSKTWDETSIGKFGALFSITHNENEVAGDRLRVQNWQERCTSYALTRPNGTNLNGQGGVAYGSNNCNAQVNAGMEVQRTFAPAQFTHLQYFQTRKRSSVNTTFQFAPTDNSEYTLDMTYLSKRDIARRNTLNLNINLPGQDIDPALYDGQPDGYQVLWDNVVLGPEIEIRNRLNEVDRTVQPVQYAEIQTAYLNNVNAQGEPKSSQRFTLGLEGVWDFDKMEISSEFSFSEAEHTRHYYATGLARWGGNRWNQQNQVLRVDAGEAIRPWGQPATIDFRNKRLPEIDWQGHTLTDIRYFRLNNVQDDGWVHEPREIALKADADYYLDFGPIKSIEFGVRFTQNIMERSTRFRFRCNRDNDYGNNGPNASDPRRSFNAEIDRPCADPSVSTTDFQNQYPGIFDIVDGFYDAESVATTERWLQINNDLYVDNRDLWREIFGFAQSGADSEVPGTSGYLSIPSETYKLTEDTAAIYVKANFEGELSDRIVYRGNAGVRGVATDIESLTRIAEAGAEDLSTQSLSHDYFNTLPSLNVAFVYDDSTILRLAAGRVMVRPTFDQLKPTGQFNTAGGGCAYYWPDDPFNRLGREVPSVDDDAQAAAVADWQLGSTPCPGIRTNTVNIGNLELDPYTADNYDLSFEQYWGEANSASVTWFYRDIGTGLTQLRTVFGIPVDPATQPVGSFEEGVEYWRARIRTNSGNETREGIELQYTQFFDFLESYWANFGVQLNYTYADGDTFDPIYTLEDERTDTDGNPITRENADDVESIDAWYPVVELSQHTYNASLFYDDGPLNVRLSYNFRDSYYTGNESQKFEDSTDRMDLNASYNFANDIGITFSIQNMLRDIEYKYFDSIYRADESRYADVVYSLGVSAKF